MAGEHIFVPHANLKTGVNLKLITFLSDFGLSDGYVGSVKGSVFSNYPDVRITDITHEIKPFQIEEAAYILMSYYNYYPKDTVHLTIVDPGVGSSRLSLIIKTANYYFVGPDNGLFSYIYQKEAYTAYAIKTELFGENISSTFHGRDIFAPVAAKLARGVKPELLAQPMNNLPVSITKHVSKNQNNFEAKIISIDRFGNIITNLTKFDFDVSLNKKIESISYKDTILKTVNKTYSDVNQGEIVALWGSAGFLEISINKGNAAEYFLCKPESDRIKIKFNK